MSWEAQRPGPGGANCCSGARAGGLVDRLSLRQVGDKSCSLPRPPLVGEQKV